MIYEYLNFGHIWQFSRDEPKTHEDFFNRQFKIKVYKIKNCCKLLIYNNNNKYIHPIHSYIYDIKLKL